MKITVPEKLVTHYGVATFAKFHPKSTRYEPHLEIELSQLTRPEVDQLLAVFDDDAKPVRGTRVIAADIRKYLKAADEGTVDVRARTCRQAAWLLEHAVARLPHHVIFSVDQYGGHSRSGFYVADVNYEPRKEGTSSRDTVPEHTDVRLAWVENDVVLSKKLSLGPGDCHQLTVTELLAQQGYVVETPDLMATLEQETVRFYALCPAVGRRCTAVGVGLADLDDATKGDRHHYYRGQVRLDNFDVASEVVVDVLDETDSEKTNSRRGNRADDLDLYRWHEWNLRFFSPSEDVLVRHLEADDDTVDRPVLQLPVHPLVPCFDLKRHLRLRVHVNNLTEYVYRAEVADGLVLPERDRRMINVLVDQSQNTFRDIVAGKGQSMNVLSGGPPGTGKTVTAEVFAEFKQRPLYNIQCSQLGLSAAEVEQNLSIILQRANRWNAVLLLDEADVYIRRRGVDIHQNAIVGVFLRILEYASCILFMTTNLPDDVDDAIASRCVVLLHYGTPAVADQEKIWRVLADLNDLPLSDADIKTFAAAHLNFSGRDVKNMLKLASFVAESEGIPLGLPALELALHFKPTKTEVKA